MGPSSKTPEPRTNDFLASASHELRTPLNAIVGMLELSLSEQLSVTLRDYLTTARDSARVLVTSLDNLLDLDKADLGEVAFDCEPIDLALVIDVALAPLLSRARLVNRAIELRMPALFPPGICGDPGRLEQILQPIVEHTFKSLDAERVVFELRPSRITESEIVLEFGVSERGLAASADRKHYEPFVPAETSKYSTAGLGLTVAERWLTRLHGQLWTDGEEHGRFYGTLTLPRNQTQLPLVPPCQPKLHRGSPSPVRRNASHSHLGSLAAPARPLHVLVADDTPANQKVVKAVLSKRGHRVELADNGRHAVDQLRRHSFDVVLMDAQMPMMNGLQATAAIRDLADVARSRVPIIAMTAHSLQADRQRCLAAGMHDYLSKPLDVATLVDCVEFHGNAGRSGGVMQMKQHPLRQPPPIEQDFLAGALARLGGDDALLRELIRLFQQDAEVLIRRIQQGIETHDAEATTRAAHNLRGLAANFDDNRTITAAGAIERAASQSQLSEALLLVPELQTALDLLLAALARYQGQTGDPGR